MAQSETSNPPSTNERRVILLSSWIGPELQAMVVAADIQCDLLREAHVLVPQVVDDQGELVPHGARLL